MASVLMLVSSPLAMASTNIKTNIKTNANTTLKPATSITAIDRNAPIKPPAPFQFALQVTRSASLYDFQDGTRNDSLNYELSPSMQTSIGTFKALASYTQNLNDKSQTASDWNDTAIIYAFPPTSWQMTDNTIRISYSLTAAIPTSQNSIKRDHLQTSLSAKIGFSVSPLADGFTYGMSISAGRNLHAYEEDINGNVLNQYSSNQNISLGYTQGDWNLSLDFTNRSRLTYRNNTKSAFEVSEEIGYSLTDNMSFSVGHTNAGPTLKANGTDSNIELYNENTSSVYAGMSWTY